MTDQQAQPVFNIEKIYVKDLSVEVPNAPAIFLERDAPLMEMQINTQSAQVDEGIYQSIITLTITAKIKDKTVFLVEAKQAGIFEIRNLPDDQLGQVMGIACPQIVYPYLRGNVADLVQRAGFPPVHLSEINFQAMYESQLQQAAAGQVGGRGRPDDHGGGQYVDRGDHRGPEDQDHYSAGPDEGPGGPGAAG